MRQHGVDTIKCFTKGTKTEQRETFDAYSEKIIASKELSKVPSIFSAELYGVPEANKYNINATEESLLSTTAS